MVVQGNNEVSPFDGGVSVLLIVPQMRFDFNGRVLRQRAMEMKKQEQNRLGRLSLFWATERIYQLPKLAK